MLCKERVVITEQNKRKNYFGRSKRYLCMNLASPPLHKIMLLSLDTKYGGKNMCAKLIFRDQNAHTLRLAVIV